MLYMFVHNLINKDDALYYAMRKNYVRTCRTIGIYNQSGDRLGNRFCHCFSDRSGDRSDNGFSRRSGNVIVTDT